MSSTPIGINVDASRETSPVMNLEVSVQLVVIFIRYRILQEHSSKTPRNFLRRRLLRSQKREEVIKT
jgi:hypothetical protein